MARGRMLNKTISMSDQFNNLPDDTCRLMATWIIAHLDMHGVFYADPRKVKSQIFSLREDITSSKVEEYIAAMERVGLIMIFESSGQKWQYWPKFRHNQGGIREDRERTTFPMPDSCQEEYSQLPDNSREESGLTQVNLTQVNSSCADAQISQPEKKREPTARDIAVSRLEKFFCQKTGLPLPPRKTSKEKRAGGQLWWNPLWVIYDVSSGANIDRAEELITLAVNQLRESKFTISSPKSIQQVAASIAAQGIKQNKQYTKVYT